MSCALIIRGLACLTVLTFLLFDCVAARPATTENVDPSEPWRNAVLIGIGIAGITIMIVVLLGCTCCQDELMNFKDDDRASGYSGMEPPNRSIPVTPRDDPGSVVTIEPLPNLGFRRPSITSKPKPPGYSQAINKGISSDDWFAVGSVNFPRNQLQYVREQGTGWFGHVVSGEASRITSHRKTKIVVKILREDISRVEQTYFLHEARFYRDLNHDNILKLLGRCVDTNPYLLIFEECQLGDLKSYLLAQRGQSDHLIKSGALVRMCCDISAGLCCMHEKGYIHNDLACRNCQVTSDGRVKIGDFGLSLEAFKDDYCFVGETAVPVRWWAPESVDASQGYVLTRDLTKPANVWTFGVVLWEVLEFCKLPYMDLSTDNVVQYVIRENNVRLRKPLTPVVHGERMFEIMQFCWLNAELRPSMPEIHAMLLYIQQNQHVVPSATDFDLKWNALLEKRASVSSGATMTAAAAAMVPPDPVPEVPVPRPPLTSPVNAERMQAQKAQRERERLEKREFIGTLSEDDLANLSTYELEKFYEFLTPEETEDLERRHRMANQRRQKREAFAAMSLAEMETMSAADLQESLSMLQQEDRRHTEEKIAMRRRVQALSDDELTKLGEADFKKFAKVFDAAELDSLKERSRVATEHVQKLNLETQRREEDLRQKKAFIVAASDQELLQLSPEVLTSSMESLTDEDRKQITTKLEAAKEHRQQMRNKILSADGLQLYTLSQQGLDQYHLSDDELLTVQQRLDDVARAREEILANPERSDFGDEFLAKYLSETEQRNIADQRLESNRQHALREEILAASDMQLYHLYQNKWDEYFPYLSMEERAGVQKCVSDFVSQRDHFMQLDDVALAAVPAEQLHAASKYFDPLEFEKLSTKWQQAQDVKRTARDEILSAEGSQLWQRCANGAQDWQVHFSPEEVLYVEQKIAALGNARDSVLRSNADELSKIPPEMLNEAMQTFNAEEKAKVQDRLQSHQQNAQRRQATLAMSDYDLSQVSDEQFRSFDECLSADELLQLATRRLDAISRRKIIIDLDDASLAHSVFTNQLSLNDYLNMFSGAEMTQLLARVQAYKDSMRDEIHAMTPAELAQMDSMASYKPVLSDDEWHALQASRNEAMEARKILFDLSDDALAELQAEDMAARYNRFLSPSEIEALDAKLRTIREARAAISPPVAPVKPKPRLSKLQVTQDENDNVLPLATPVQKHAHDSKRAVVFELNDDELCQIPQQSFEELFEVMSPEEIWAFEERLQRLRSTPGSVDRAGRPSLSSMNSISRQWLTPMDSLHLQPEHEARFDTPLEARDYVMKLTDDDLLKMPMKDVESFYGYLSIDECQEIQHRIQWAKDAKRQYILSVSDVELREMTPDRLVHYQQYLTPEEQTQVRRRVAAVQSLSFSSPEDSSVEQHRDPEAYRKYLAMTQVSISSNEAPSSNLFTSPPPAANTDLFGSGSPMVTRAAEQLGEEALQSAATGVDLSFDDDLLGLSRQSVETVPASTGAGGTAVLQHEDPFENWEKNHNYEKHGQQHAPTATLQLLDDDLDPFGLSAQPVHDNAGKTDQHASNAASLEADLFGLEVSGFTSTPMVSPAKGVDSTHYYTAVEDPHAENNRHALNFSGDSEDANTTLKKDETSQ